MKRLLFPTILALVIATNAGVGHADEVFNKMQAEKENTVYALFSYDPNLVFGVGYARAFDIKKIKRVFGLMLDISFPMFAFDFTNYKLDLGTRIAFFKSKWNLINRFSILNKGASNAVYTANQIGFEEGLLGGYFAKDWFVAVEANYEKYLLTHMEHTDYYRHIYPDVKDGWYKSMGGKWRFALQGGYTIKNVVEVALRVGTYWNEKFSPPVLTMPLFVALAVNVRIDDLKKGSKKKAAKQADKK
jgi:hypothetical protein